MAEYSRIAKGNFTASASTAQVILPFTPDFVELWNYTNIKTAGANKVTRAWWDNKLLDGSNNPTMIEGYNNSTVVVFDEIATNGITSYQAALALQYGPRQQVVSATKANPVVFTVTGHGYQVGDTVIFEGLYQSATTGMPQMCGIPFTISAVTTNTFTVKWDGSGSNYTALSGSPSGAYVKKVLYPFLYVPQDNVISALTLAATTTVTTTAYHNFEVGQEIAFRIPASWGTTQLNSLPNNVIPGSPVYGYVTSITDNWTFVCNINSSSYTAFNPNQTVASVPGLTFPQVLSVGDVNTGGNLISATSSLYPSPSFPTSTNRVSTINGPAIRGSFVTNTNQGFVIGAGTGATDSSFQLITSGDVVYWRAYLSDFANP